MFVGVVVFGIVIFVFVVLKLFLFFMIVFVVLGGVDMFLVYVC